MCHILLALLILLPVVELHKNWRITEIFQIQTHLQLHEGETLGTLNLAGFRLQKSTFQVTPSRCHLLSE